jgi:ABC-type multidrug transport system fused ATPase/permease subunit
VQFDHVSFSYDSGDAVLNDLTFTVPAGTVLGLLGRTGSGKTTIARLLCRLYDPAAGAVSVGGVDLRHLSREALRQHVALVTQDVQLFQASVRDNISFFDRSVDDERILEAFEQLGLAAWCRSLANGLDTMLGANGAGLSAGEGQLLALARVFLRNPSVVILDEASSRLDPVTERLLERAISALLANRTTIIIAHRLTTIARASDILILERGDIVEYGPRLDLLNNPSSRLAALFRLEAKEVLV